MPTRSYLASIERTVTFGLGQSSAVDKVEIFWPDGSREVVAVDGVDRLYRFTQGSLLGAS
jgi:hypothetical protein